MQKWKKMNIEEPLFVVRNNNEWAASHCHKPTPLLLDDKIMRIYFGVRDIKGRTRTTFVDVDTSDLYNFKVVYLHNKPVIDLGPIGAFDDSGANVSSIIRTPSGDVYMYYIGWNPSTTVHTRNSIGMVISKDGGTTFEHPYVGAVLDRDKNEPYYTGAVDVIYDEGVYKCYYTYGHKWEVIDGKPEICYYIRYATSNDGIDFVRDGIDCILPEKKFEATARPCVIKEDGIYKMWYSKRFMNEFRTNMRFGYRAGYAESSDGMNWNRRDEKMNLFPSASGWDSEAIAYPYVIEVRGTKVCLYNGNGFGRTGFGYAVLE